MKLVRVYADNGGFLATQFPNHGYDLKQKSCDFWLDMKLFFK